MKCVLFLSHLTEEEAEAEGASGLPKVKQLMGGRARIHTQAFLTHTGPACALHKHVLACYQSCTGHRDGESGDSAQAAQALLSGPPTCALHSGLDSCLLEAQTSEHRSLGLGSEGFQVAQLGGALLVKVRSTEGAAPVAQPQFLCCWHRSGLR